MGRLTAVAAGVIGTLVPLALTACGGDAGDGEARASATPSQSISVSSVAPATPTSSAPAMSGGDGARIGGGKTGVTLTLPKGWRQVDPTQDSSPAVRTSFGLDIDMGELVRQLMARQIQQGVVFAIDGSATSGFAPHLTAGCDRGGAVGASLDQLKRKQQALEPGSRITDLTVGGKPGFKATYDSTNKSGPVSGMTVRVSLSADRFCFVDIEARQGAMPPDAERIADSFTLA
ncbi:hypothetical protein ABZ801_27890 [Actinomadura sp. NPDC047616]|uniref:hypothetical protein n=1 Tax=Actinomadura sp. NPDC047616 TaxID=3155914 RepID=UPI0033D5EE54